MRYYDRQGNPISLAQWSALLGDPEYSWIAQDRGAGRLVSTVWLGLDHRHGGGGPPLIFETMVFMVIDGEVEYSEIDADRYSTEEEALKGHARMAEGHAYVLDKLAKKLEGEDAD